MWIYCQSLKNLWPRSLSKLYALLHLNINNDNELFKRWIKSLPSWKKYFCSLCNFRTHKKYNLEVHKKNKHGTSQTGSGVLLSDNQCSYSSSRKYDLKKHERLKHYQKKIKCHQSSYSSSRKYDLKDMRDESIIIKKSSAQNVLKSSPEVTIYLGIWKNMQIFLRKTLNNYAKHRSFCLRGRGGSCPPQIEKAG